MRGVILCGGLGTRLRPMTLLLNKHLCPIGNYPMVLFPLATLKSMGVTDIMIITGGNHVGDFAEFLGDGSRYGCSFTYKVQEKAGGIPQALALAEGFVGNNSVVVILGDNVFETTKGSPFADDKESATLWVKHVEDASRFGVLMEGSNTIVEKPTGLTRGNAVTGLYKYPPSVFDFIRTLKPSARGELEITDVNNFYLGGGKCNVSYLGDVFWSDCGTPDSLARTTRYFLDNPGALKPLDFITTV